MGFPLAYLWTLKQFYHLTLLLKIIEIIYALCIGGGYFGTNDQITVCFEVSEPHEQVTIVPPNLRLIGSGCKGSRIKGIDNCSKPFQQKLVKFTR